MPQFNHIYDGKNTGITAPSGERVDRALAGMNSIILEADKMKLEAFQKNQDWFLKTSDVPIESYLNSASATYQSELIDKYNKTVQDILKSRGGDFNNLTTQDKLELQKGRQFLVSEQQRMLGDQEKYKIASQVVNRDPNLDPVKFNKIMQGTFFQGKPFPDEAVDLSIKAKNLGVYFNNYKAKGTEDPVSPEYRTLTGGKQEVRDRRYGSTIGQTKEFIAQSILNDRGLLEGAYEEFNALPESKKWEYLKDFDTSGDGKLDATELNSIPAKESTEPTNPILRYAQDKYLELAREDRSSAWRGSTASASSSFDWSVSISDEHNQNSTFEVQKGIKFGSITFDTFLNLGQAQNTPKTMQIQKFVDLETGEEIAFESSAEYKTVGYSPEKDVIVVSITKDANANGINLFAGKNIGLRGNQYNDFLSKKPFGIDRASLMKNNTQPTQAKPQLSVPDWRKIPGNEKRPISEYPN